jgi:hypothetical protein
MQVGQRDGDQRVGGAEEGEPEADFVSFYSGWRIWSGRRMKARGGIR